MSRQTMDMKNRSVVILRRSGNGAGMGDINNMIW